MFSILIPTWNNLAYLKLCIQSIRQHSHYQHELVVHVNEGSDGTLKWLQQEGIQYSHSHDNIGVCLSVNHLAGMATKEWLLYMNDDMVCSPGWDEALTRKIKAAPDDRIFLSSLLIEPTPTKNNLVIFQNYGLSPDDFDAKKFASNYADIPHADMPGRASQPTLIARRWWTMVGGYSLEFSPGMSSDDDLLMKLWVVGFRDFIIVGDSRLYHFACRSTGRIRKNRGSRTFVLKWGITQKEFKQQYLNRSSRQVEPQAASSFPHATWRGRIKRAIYGMSSGLPLHDVFSWNPSPGAGMITPELTAGSDPYGLTSNLPRIAEQNPQG